MNQCCQDIVDAEAGKRGPVGWRYADAGSRVWSRWLGPLDEAGEPGFPLLSVAYAGPVGGWQWEIYRERYVRVAQGCERAALLAMRAAESALDAMRRDA